MDGRILIADDDRVLAEVVHFNLEISGYEPVVVHDGETALELTRGERFDLIISDFQMPRRCGYELCKAVRAEPLNRDTPIIFCSAKSFELDVEEVTRELRVARLFMKPFSPSELVAAVREILAERAAAITA